MAGHRILEAAVSAAVVTAGLLLIGTRGDAGAADRDAIVLDGGVAPTHPPDAALPPILGRDAGPAPPTLVDAGPVPGRDAGLPNVDAGAPPLPRDAGPSPARPR